MATVQEQIAELESAADRMRPRIARAFRDSLERMRDRMTDAEIAALFEQGDTAAIIEGIAPFNDTDDLRAIGAAISQAVIEGGETAASVQASVTGPNGRRVDFVFDAANPQTAPFAREMTSKRIREVSESVRETTRQVITDAVNRGDNPLTTARRVKQSVGLTARQHQSVMNYRRALETAHLRQAEALERHISDDTLDDYMRELRDRRFDRSVFRAIRTGEPLSASQIDRMVDRYQQRFIDYRARTIARTESIRAIQGGQHLFMQQQVDEGRIEKRQIRRFWHTSRDEKVRSSHRFIPSMNENGVGQDEHFRTPLGPLMYPGDPSGSAGNVINCRCTAISRVISMELLEDDAA